MIRRNQKLSLGGKVLSVDGSGWSLWRRRSPELCLEVSISHLEGEARSKNATAQRGWGFWHLLWKILEKRGFQPYFADQAKQKCNFPISCFFGFLFTHQLLLHHGLRQLFRCTSFQLVCKGTVSTVVIVSTVFTSFTNSSLD